MSLAKHHRVRCWNSILTTSTRGLAFSVDGEHVALSDAGGSLAIFDVAKGVPLHLVQFPPLVQATAIVWRSNSELFVGCTDGVVAALRLSSLRNNASNCEVSQWMPDDIMPAIVSGLAWEETACSLAVAYGSVVDVYKLLHSPNDWKRTSQFRLTEAHPVLDLAFISAVDILVGYKGNGICVLNTTTKHSLALTGLHPSTIVKTAIAKEGIVIATFQDGHVGLYKVTGAPFYTLAPISGWTDNLSNSSIRIGSNSPLAIASNERVSLVAFGRRDGFVALMEVPSLAMGPSPSFPKNAGSELLSPTDDARLHSMKVFIRSDCQVVVSVSKLSHTPLLQIEVWSDAAGLYSSQAYDLPSMKQSHFGFLLDDAMKWDRRLGMITWSWRWALATGSALMPWGERHRQRSYAGLILYYTAASIGTLIVISLISRRLRFTQVPESPVISTPNEATEPIETIVRWAKEHIIKVTVAHPPPPGLSGSRSSLLLVGYDGLMSVASEAVKGTRARVKHLVATATAEVLNGVFVLMGLVYKFILFLIWD